MLSSLWACVECCVRTGLFIEHLLCSQRGSRIFCVPGYRCIASPEHLLCDFCVPGYRYIASPEHLLCAFSVPGTDALHLLSTYYVPGTISAFLPDAGPEGRSQFSHVAPPPSPRAPCQVSRLPAAPQGWHDVTCPWAAGRTVFFWLGPSQAQVSFHPSWRQNDVTW